MQSEINLKKEEVEQKKAEITKISEQISAEPAPNASELESMNQQKKELERQLEEKNGKILSLEYFVYKAIGKLHKYKI